MRAPADLPALHHRLDPERRRVLHAAATLGCLALAPGAIAGKKLPPVPYIPTPRDVVDRMLAMARITASDTVYDLGCGDGRIVIEAARRHGARGYGIDLDPWRIREAKENARRAGVAHRVRFEREDLFATDLAPASVVMLYLLFEVNLKLMPRLWKQLAVGTRVVSHDFHMGAQWPPQQILRVRDHTVYGWTITPDLKQVEAAPPPSPPGWP